MMFGALNFFKNYSAVKSEQAMDKLVDLTVSLDQDAAILTAIKQKQEEHEVYVNQLIEDSKYLEQQQRELDDVTLLYKQRVAAAELAKADYIADNNNIEAKTALDELLSGIEKLLPQLEKEKQDVIDAAKIVEETRIAAQEVANELSKMTTQISELKHNIQVAEREAEKAERERMRQEKLVGLKTAGNKFDVATQALQKKIDSAKEEALRHKTVAEQLSATKPSSDASAKYMSNVKDTSTETLEDRMSRLLK